MKKVLIILLVFIPFLAIGAQEKMRIAIMDFEAKDIPKSEAVKISELIRNDIINTGSYTVVERSQMDKILKEQGFQQTGCTDVSCAVEIGKMLSTKKILVGTVMQLGDNIVITGRIVDVEKGTAEFSEKQTAGSKNQIYSAVSKFVDNLTDKINGNYKNSGTENGTKSAQADNNPYGILTLSSLGLTAVSFGGGYYFDTRIKSANDSYKSLIPYYNNATDTATATGYHTSMENKQDEAEKYTLYRNISYGVGGAMTILSGYLIYKYYSYTPATGDIKTGYKPLILPVFYTSLYKPEYSNKTGFSFAGGVLIRF